MPAVAYVNGRYGPIAEAGVSVAYHAKPTVRRQAMVAINQGGLDRLLEVLPA